MQTKKSNKELINCFKDYINIADASYAMLHNVFENERNGLDELYEKWSKLWKYPKWIFICIINFNKPQTAHNKLIIL